MSDERNAGGGAIDVRTIRAVLRAWDATRDSVRHLEPLLDVVSGDERDALLGAILERIEYIGTIARSCIEALPVKGRTQ